MFNFSGGMLTGSEIEKQIKKGNIKIDPFDESCINPNSYNLKLHPEILIYDRNIEYSNTVLNNTNSSYYRPNDFDEDNYCIESFDSINNLPIINSYYKEPLDMNKDNKTIKLTIPEEGLVLQPGILYIGRTIENTWTDKYVPMINGRSSVGRLGISIHICAGFGDIGFNGTWTLEITAVEPVRIYPNTEIAQVCFFKPNGNIKKLYKGRYMGQKDATASRFHQPKGENN